MFVDENNIIVFSFLFREIQKVRLDPSEFFFKTVRGNYLVSLFNLKKQSAEFGIGGVAGMTLGTREVQSGNQKSLQLENIIKEHRIQTYGLKTNADYGRHQLLWMILIFLFGLIVFWILGVIINLHS